MLSEENYKALLRFRDGPVKYDTKLTEREDLLRQSGLIRLVHRRETVEGENYSMTYNQGYWKITALGQDALEEFENAVLGKMLQELEAVKKEMHQQHSDFESYKKTMDAKQAKEKRDSIVFGAITAIIGSAIGGLIVLYWPLIVSSISTLFH